MTQILRPGIREWSPKLPLESPDGASLTSSATPRQTIYWGLALAGQFVFVFAALALSGPGRIDIVDGQTRYDVARSLIDHGDSVIRDKEVSFAVYEGRNGERYTNYRFPQSGAGLVAILAADATGPVSEGRRQFFFTLISSFAAAILGLTYSIWFRHLGSSPGASLAWATAGIFCTPSWYYGTSTFDDILGASTIVLAVAVAWLCRDKRPLLGAAFAGLLMACAINCKQPLGFFVLPVLAAGYSRNQSPRQQLLSVGLVLSGLVLGVVAYKLYDWYKFPPGTSDATATYVERYGDIWTLNPLPGLASLALSPSCGCVWYCPTVLLSYYGWKRWRIKHSRFCQATLAAFGLFTLFFSFLTFFKGEPCWGPRYLTPVFALGWVFAPAAAAVVRRLFLGTVLGAGIIVQLLALSMDPMRLFLETPLAFNYYYADPWLSFNSATSHLLHRPGEIANVVRSWDKRAPRFSPAPLPTHAGGMMTPAFTNIASVVALMATPQGLCSPVTLIGEFKAAFAVRAEALYKRAFHRYHIFNSFRPWWASQDYVPESERPVDLANTAVLLGILSALGLALMIVTSRNCPDEAPEHQPTSAVKKRKLLARATGI